MQRTKIDHSGRVCIPAAIRKALGLAPGTALAIEIQDGEIRLRPLPQQEAPLVKKGEVWVVRSAPLGDVAGIEREMRKERLAHLLDFDPSQ